jgi:transcriptional regulator with XRE-family HTH domain
MVLELSKPDEVVALICSRLRHERLALKMTQSDVAARAGISSGTLSNLESGRGVALESVVRVATVLGRVNELEALFKPRLQTLEDFARYETAAARQRVRKKTNG